MMSETQAVKQAIVTARKGATPPQIAYLALGLLMRGQPKAGRAGFNVWAYTDAATSYVRQRGYIFNRLLARISKKLGQPHRRKDRGPLRAKANGKNEVTRRSGRH